MRFQPPIPTHLAAISFLLCGFLGSPEAHGLPSTDTLDRRLDEFVQPFVDLGMFNGVILVAEGDHVIATRTYGNANYEHDVPITLGTRFRIASLSKQFTLASIAVLIDQEKLSAESRLVEFIPDFPRASEITIAHLVNHQSGIPHTNVLEKMKNQTQMSLEEVVDVLKNEPLDFDPGSADRYSNGGFAVLAAIIEHVSGLSYDKFLDKEVFQQLGLDGSGRLETYEVVAKLAQGYLPGTLPGGRSLPRFYPASLRHGGGSLYSTAEDVWRLFRHTFTRRFASKQTSDFLFWDETARYEITGRSPGFVAKVFIDIPNDIVVVSLANNYTWIHAWGRRLYQIAIDEPWEVAPLTPRKPHITATQAKTLTGLYQLGDKVTIRISVDDKTTLVFEDAANDWRVALVPLANDRYLHPFFDNICEFTHNKHTMSLICRPELTKLKETLRYERVTP